MEKNRCKWCDTELQSAKRVFCSISCYGEYLKVSENNPMFGRSKKGEKHPKQSVTMKKLYKEGKLKPWSKGKTKDNCESLEKNSETRKERYRKGEIISWNKGKTKYTDIRLWESSVIKQGNKNPAKRPEVREKLSKAWKDTDKRRDGYVRGGKTRTGRKRPQIVKDKISKAKKKQWKDPDFREKMHRSWSSKPSKIEERIMEIIEKHNLPFKHTGDGSIWIYGLNPDFVECNGKKLIIEVFGDYWHGNRYNGLDWRRTEFGRKAIFSQLGYDTLILWESEINKMNDNEIADVIKGFDK